jgi:hypothetical protein
MFRITLNRVHDKVNVREMGESLILRVDGDPIQMTIGLNRVQKELQALNAAEEKTMEDALPVARMFSEVIFGKTQTEKLVELYNGDAACVISVCGQYLTKRLAKRIVRAQKRHKNETV